MLDAAGLSVNHGFCSVSNGLSVQFGCTWELSCLENGPTLHQFPGGDARYFNAGRNRPETGGLSV